MKLLDRLVWSAAVGVIALVVGASVLPRVLPSLIVVFALAVVGRGVWFVTRR
jgi:hypothetical protein